MPARRRAQEAKRAARRVLDARPKPVPVVDQVEAAYRENENPWCCPDCDPHHPANTLNAAIEEIEAYRALPEEVRL